MRGGLALAPHLQLPVLLRQLVHLGLLPLALLQQLLQLGVLQRGGGGGEGGGRRGVAFRGVGGRGGVQRCCFGGLHVVLLNGKRRKSRCESQDRVCPPVLNKGSLVWKHPDPNTRTLASFTRFSKTSYLDKDTRLE